MRRIALIVANGDYSDKKFHDLPFAKNDAARVSTLLSSLPKGSNFECVPLFDPTDEEVFKKIKEIKKELHKGDVFIFYFAGHGLLRGSEDYLLLCKNAPHDVCSNPKQTNGAICCSWLKKQIMEKSVDALFCFDSCRSNLEAGARAGADDVMPTGTEETLKKIFSRDISGRSDPSSDEQGGRIWELHACADNQRAFETEWVENGLTRQGGVFTAALVECADELRDAGESIVIDNPFINAASKKMRKFSGDSKQSIQLTAPDGQGFVLSDGKDAAQPQIKIETIDESEDSGSETGTISVGGGSQGGDTISVTVKETPLYESLLRILFWLTIVVLLSVFTFSKCRGVKNDPATTPTPTSATPANTNPTQKPDQKLFPDNGGSDNGQQQQQQRLPRK